VAGVLDYGARAFGPGLRLVRAPGNDAVSSTALAAAGAQLILFTTGRGTPFGCAVPTLKIASNSALAAAKPHWIDFDAGSLLAGQAMEDSADALFRLLVSVVSGRPTKAEQNGCREIAIFKTGVTL
jgi:altronate hydrolase